MIILEYHSVQEKSKCKFMLTTNEFENHIKFFLSKNYKFVNFMDNKIFSLDKKSVLVTFDDGYSDNYKYVFSIIKKYNIPIIIFLATNYIGKTMKLGGIEVNMLNIDEIKEMHESGLVYFGSHTHSHILLDSITDSNMIKKDIEKSKEIIFQLLGYETRFFCYPKGRKNKQFKYILNKEFDYAVTTQLGCVKNEDKINLPRIEIYHNENKIKQFLKLYCCIWIINVAKKIIYGK